MCIYMRACAFVCALESKGRHVITPAFVTSHVSCSYSAQNNTIAEVMFCSLVRCQICFFFDNK